jgi:hypothetical protein
VSNSILKRVRFLRGLPALLVLILATLFASWSQEPSTAGADKSAAIAPGAQSANDLMLLAAKENGLGGEDAAPWHLKASYTLTDESGKVTDEGTYEEFWVSSTKYKRIYAGNAFSQTDYGTDKNTMRVGSKEPVPVLLEQARREFANPLPDPGLVGKARFELKETETSGIKLECLHSTGAPLGPDRTYCVGADKPFVRIISSEWGASRFCTTESWRFAAASSQAIFNLCCREGAGLRSIWKASNRSIRWTRRFSYRLPMLFQFPKS